MTTFFSLEGNEMYYSGRRMEGKLPDEGSFMKWLFEYVNSPEMWEKNKSSLPDEYELPRFNSAFVNYYRPSDSIDKMDGLGWHADDEDNVKEQRFCL